MGASQELRVLHLNTEPAWGGGEQQVLYLMDGLARRGVFGVLAAQPDGPLAERARARAHRVVELRMRGAVDLPAMLAIRRLIRRERVSIVHCHTSHAHTLGAVAAATTGKARRPGVVVSRRVASSAARHRLRAPSRIKYLLGADRYVAVSAAVRRVLIGDGIPPDRIVTVHSGIDVARIEGAAERSADLRAELDVPRDGALVGNVGRLSASKGQRHLLEAVPRILADHPDATFAIVGEGELRSELEALARALGIAHRVRFTGFRTDVPSLLKAFDVLVMPSLREGLGTSVLDAMAAGCPVVGTEAGGLPELIEDGTTGLVVPVGDPASLAAAVSRLLTHPEEASRMARAARERVSAEFSADAMVERTLAVYRDLMAAVDG